MLAVVVTVTPTKAELVSETLWSMGVGAIEERAAGRGLVELWTFLGDDLAAISERLASIQHLWRFEVVDPGAGETWRQFARPTWVTADLVVYPSWSADPAETTAGETPAVETNAVEPGDGGHDGHGATRRRPLSIAIDPGATFGMGDHPTTILCLQALNNALVEGGSVLDVGCGSGLLAIAACKLGASFAEAIDISAVAVPTTIANARCNGVGAKVRASNTPLASIRATFDVVVANILAPVLIEMSADLRRVVADDGVLVIGGILAERHDHVLAALRPLRQIARIDLDCWTAISLRA